MLSHLSETYCGVVCIRSFGREQDFLNQFLQKMNTNVLAYYWNFAANRWLGKISRMASRCNWWFSKLCYKKKLRRQPWSTICWSRVINFTFLRHFRKFCSSFTSTCWISFDILVKYYWSSKLVCQTIQWIRSHYEWSGQNFRVYCSPPRGSSDCGW